ncbi:MAG: peptidylprolyl isomerase [Syntrophales bacterium]
MKNRIYRNIIFIFTCLVILVIGGCNSKEEKPKVDKTLHQNSEEKQSVPQSVTQSVAPADSSSAPSVKSSGIVAEVDGTKLTQAKLDKEISNKLVVLKDHVPADRLQQVKTELRGKLIDEFILRTLLTNEVNRQKISFTEKDVTEAIDKLKATLPSGVTIEDIMEKNRTSEEEMRKEIRLGIRINKLVLSTIGGEVKPKEKEIAEFYQKNKEKFKIPETVHVRHILIAKNPEDDDKAKVNKKKAEDLRKKLLAGSDFAELARKNSDCPSKENGGDLGMIPRGQMVKPFEDAAFSQEKDAIGPVVETDFGYHIIQVLKHNAPKTMSLDKKTKENIASFLEREKLQEAFAALVEKLKAKATIVVSGQQ